MLIGNSSESVLLCRFVLPSMKGEGGVVSRVRLVRSRVNSLGASVNEVERSFVMRARVCDVPLRIRVKVV